MTEKKIREVLLPPHDVWLSAKEAKKYGICDEIRELK
jgi:ATP-dependent protease ClpP protease subunit